MENINADAIKTKETELKQLFESLKVAYKAANQTLREYEAALFAWDYSDANINNKGGASASARKRWPASLTAAFEAATVAKANHKSLNERSKALRAEILAMKRANKQAFRETNGAECQICARLILAQNGKIAHHGYTRPRGRGMWHSEGPGYQTASCLGALELPYEKSIEVLKPYLEALNRTVAGLAARLADLKANPPASLTDNSRTAPRTIAKPEGDFRYTEYGRLYEYAIYQLEREHREMSETANFHAVRVAEWKPRELKRMTVANS